MQAAGAAYEREAQTPPVFVALLWKILQDRSVPGHSLVCGCCE